MQEEGEAQWMAASAYSTGYSSQHAHQHMPQLLHFSKKKKRKNWTVNNPKMADSLFPIGAGMGKDL